MIEVFPKLYVGDQGSCRHDDPNLFVVHACKSPCHQTAVGYSGSLPKDSPYYLDFYTGSDLYLNLIDPPVPLFMPASFRTFLHHVVTRKGNILIHCNEGLSRAPSLALLYMAKGLGAIPNDSYAAARKEFEKIYPEYRPGQGIQTYLTDNWGRLE
jgi:hypothetical protein